MTRRPELFLVHQGGGRYMPQVVGIKRVPGASLAGRRREMGQVFASVLNTELQDEGTPVPKGLSS